MNAQSSGPNSGPNPDEEIYLGDGLYAQFDGFSVRLRAPRTEGDHEVFLEPWMLTHLIQCAKEWGMIQ